MVDPKTKYDIISHNRHQQKWEGCAFFIFSCVLYVVVDGFGIGIWFPFFVKIKIIIRIIIDFVSFYYLFLYS